MHEPVFFYPYYKIENNIKWEDKISTALFRGSGTGSMELEFNQRLQISKLDYEWKETKPGLLDAGIVSWNSRDKIDSKLQINYINGSILHHYHGSIANRKYQERWSILTNNQYDPTIDISYNNNGIIHLSSQGKRFEEPILNYFKERLEDTTD